MVNGEDDAFRAIGGKGRTVYASGCTVFLKLLIEDDKTKYLKNPVIFGKIYDSHVVGHIS